MRGDALPHRHHAVAQTLQARSPELTRHTLEALRQPLEDGTITIARARSTVCFPTSFLLVAAGLWRDALWADPTSLDRSRLNPQAQRPVPRGQAQGSSP